MRFILTIRIDLKKKNLGIKFRSETFFYMTQNLDSEQAFVYCSNACPTPE